MSGPEVIPFPSGQLDELQPGASAKQIITAINSIYRLTALAASVHIGQLILRVYFQDDYEVYKTSRSDEHTKTLEEIVEELDAVRGVELDVSTSYLSDAVRISHAYSRLPEDVRNTLAVSHYRLLLRLKESEWERTAKKVARDGMSVRKLKQLVDTKKQRSRSGAKRGRKKDIGFKRVVTQLHNLTDEIDLDEIDSLDDSTYQQLEPKEWEAEIAKAEAFIERAQEAVARLREKLNNDTDEDG